MSGIRSVKALLLGQRIDLRGLQQARTLARDPFTIEVQDGGMAVLFRFGAVVLIGVSAIDEAAFIDKLRPFVQDPFESPETESLDVRAAAEGEESLADGMLQLPGLELPHLQLVAEVLARSVLLAAYERDVTTTFDRVEPMAEQLQRSGRGHRQSLELTRHIGETLRIQHRLVGRAAVGEKPELLWEHPELERIYHRLENEYELDERQLALERKLTLISSTAETLLDLLQTSRSLRVEWYIVILIVVEIGLTLYELFVHNP